MFSAREPSQKSSRIKRAFALNVCPCSTKSVPNGLDLLTTPGLTRRSGGNISTTQIDSNYLGCLTRWWSVYLNNKVDVIVTFLGFTQCCTGEALPSKQCNLIATNGQLKVNSSTLKSHSYCLSFLHVSKCADIQTDRSGSEFVDLFDSFGVVNHPSNGLANVISLKPRSFPYRFVNLVVKLGGIPAIVPFSHCQYLVASISKSPQSLIELWSKLYRDYKLALYRQGLSHKTIIAHPVCKATKVATRVPPRESSYVVSLFQEFT